MTSSPRVLVAGLYHETHTFLSDRTPLSDFRALRGEELLGAAGDSSPLGGALETARTLGWEIVPTLDLRATPGGTVEDHVLQEWWNAVGGAIASHSKLDAIFLVLHGAMCTECCRDVEGEILARLRRLPGMASIPIGGVTDLHANVPQRVADRGGLFVTYRQNPHTDAREAACRAVSVLDGCLRSGVSPTVVRDQPPIVWPPTGTGTADLPMRLLEDAARELERTHSELLAVNVHGGFAFADTPQTGPSFTAVTTADPDAARQALQTLSQIAREHRGVPQELTLKEAMDRVEQILQSPGDGPILLVEPSDNVGAGAPADGVLLLSALVERRTPNAAVAICDPAVVLGFAGLAPGARRTVELGGKGSTLSGGPILLELELVSRSDGRFELEDRQSHLASMGGQRVKMGPCVVVRHEGVKILVTSRRTPPMDLGQFRSQGIRPESLSVIGVKAAVAHRRVYDPIARASLTVATPGPCPSDLRKLPYRQIRRPIWPLDASE